VATNTSQIGAVVTIVDKYLDPALKTRYWDPLTVVLAAIGGG
jgi:hypothetical protein